MTGQLIGILLNVTKCVTLLIAAGISLDLKFHRTYLKKGEQQARSQNLPETVQHWSINTRTSTVCLKEYFPLNSKDRFLIEFIYFLKNLELNIATRENEIKRSTQSLLEVIFLVVSDDKNITWIWNHGLSVLNY